MSFRVCRSGSSMPRLAAMLGGLLVAVQGEAAGRVLEAESFADCGGWQTDQQFMDVMGSPYLLAHGIGTPVRDAVTTVSLGEGRFDLWVRTRDWVAPNGPGRFEVKANGRGLGVFGRGGDGSWKWEKGASIVSDGSPVEIRLHDLTGFEGRVDALAFLPPGETPPARFDRGWRARMLGFAVEAKRLPSVELVVVGVSPGCARPFPPRARAFARRLSRIVPSSAETDRAKSASAPSAGWTRGRSRETPTT